ncbi:hypothetical protein [Halorhodospira halochloris]|uniref:hypothetical protein n=1 Tax=Halorhodospira halochloris TaxID=1052 RepID=UPI001EE9A0D4|nr:hypothetical protein [Halorhodospira halochloris]MCG5549500.1 hypothetical protein [Halorhodospira halochloris]
MATEHALITAAVVLSAPWEVSDIRFDAEAKRIDFDGVVSENGKNRTLRQLQRP